MIRIIRRQSPPHVAVLLACQQWLWASSAVQNLLLAELAFRFVDYSVRRHTPIQAIRCELLVVAEVVLDERTHVTVLALAGAVSALVERFRRIVRFVKPADMCATKQRIILQPVGQGSRHRTQIELDRCEQPLLPILRILCHQKSGSRCADDADTAASAIYRRSLALIEMSQRDNRAAGFLTQPFERSHHLRADILTLVAVGVAAQKTTSTHPRQSDRYAAHAQPVLSVAVRR